MRYEYEYEYENEYTRKHPPTKDNREQGVIYYVPCFPRPNAN